MNIQQDIDQLVKVNSADIKALEDARFTLEAIKNGLNSKWADDKLHSLSEQYTNIEMYLISIAP